MGVFPLSKSIGNTSTYRLSDFIHISCSNGTGQKLNKRSIKRSGSAEMDVVYSAAILLHFQAMNHIFRLSRLLNHRHLISGNEANCDTKKSESNYGSVPIEDTCQKNLPSKRIEKARFKKMFPEHDLYCCI